MFSNKVSIFIFFVTTQFLFRPISCIQFVYNSNFTTNNTLLVGSATVDSPPSILTLTNQTIFSIGRGLYHSRISTAASAIPLPFATSFIFSMAPYKHLSPGHGFAFVFLPFSETSAASSSQHLGLFNLTNNGATNNRIFAVEFDVFANQEFNDINDNHVGVDVNSLNSVSSEVAGFYGGRDGERFTELRLNSGENYQAWIEFNGSALNATMARAGTRKPIRPLISIPLNLTGVLLDDMFVGFTASTGQLVQSHRILSWSFSNSNFSIGDALITRNLPSFKLSYDSVLKSKGFIAGVSSGVVLLLSVIGFLCFYVVRRRRRQKLEGDVEDWETEYWPHRVQYKDVLEATKGFSEENMIGYGGNSKVYRGVLEGKEVAVKRIMMSPRESVSGTSEFLAEVSSLGRLRHKNIVGLKGWSKKGGESLVLIYEYMENGSVDKRIFDCNEMLNWEERMRVIRDVASGMLYLHEGWESKVLHRDIKSSNVLLDNDMNARVGDFGLAKLQNTSKEMVSTTHVVGTAGYMAPELVKTGRASAQTDVYSFGVFVLEVVCGRRPIEEGREGIVEWIWRLMEKDKVVDGLDERVKVNGRFKTEEVEMALRIGLLCVHPDPRVRPKMRQVVQILEQGRLVEDGGEREMSLLERVKSSYLLETGEGSRQRQHPTIQDVRNSSHCSNSFQSYGSILHGR
ncbi:PREDICTED: probable L-type lectin-domain containing receptor kinase VII.2 [Camelina sativa]|uniref:Probable L-type lectin-domain containing receptor kinase VII.2 n=1 Tax=Camelina sativa TaxID=90675 RepID=A0ABM0TYF0_CAMSA|nr:PREDICTED: probable L-type lectin-domain containing receptor kinase VII.2 [Camelina sativa]